MWAGHSKGKWKSLNPLGLVEDITRDMDHSAKMHLGIASVKNKNNAWISHEQNTDHVENLRHTVQNTFCERQGTRDMSGPVQNLHDFILSSSSNHKMTMISKKEVTTKQETQ